MAVRRMPLKITAADEFGQRRRRPPRLLIGAKEPATKTLEGGLKWWPGANGSRPLHLVQITARRGSFLRPVVQTQDDPSIASGRQ